MASVSWGVSSVLSRRVPLPPGLVAPGAQMLWGGGLLLILNALMHPHLPAVLSVRTTVAFVYLVAAAAAGYAAYAYLLANVRPALATSNAYVNPVVAVGLGFAFAGERLTVMGGVALLLILAGVGLTAGTKQTKEKGESR